MRVAGGIIAIIAGVFAVFAAGFTLFTGGVASTFEAEGAGTVVMLGWGGVLFSFLTIVLGAVMLAVESKFVAILMILCAIGGAILGGTFVAVFMALALVGGVLSFVCTEKPENLERRLTLISLGLALMPIPIIGFCVAGTGRYDLQFDWYLF